MNISKCLFAFASVTLAALFCVNNADAKNKFANPKPYYQPITINENSGLTQGIWLVNAQSPTDPIIQLTNMPLDGNGGNNAAIFATWNYNTAKQEALKVAPRLLVYGLNGMLYSENLKTPDVPKQFSSGTYTELCSLTALDGESYKKASSYLQAVVIPSGSGDCTTGVGTQSWLIPASANQHTAPTVETFGWKVLTAFATLADGAFQGWVVDNGSSVELDDANFNFQSNLLTGLASGDQVSILAGHGSIIFVLLSRTVGSTTTNTIYRMTTSGAASIGSYSYDASATCVVSGGVGGSIIDAGNDFLAFAEPTNSGYSIYRASLVSGSAVALYTDASGNECGALPPEEVSAGHVVVNEVSPTTGTSRVIGVAETGAPDQIPAILATGDANTYLSATYVIDGHAWIDDYQFPDSGPVVYSELVRNGDGTSVATYPGSRRIDDIWGGFHLGDNPGIDRQVVYLYTPNNTDACNGGTLAAIDPVTFGLTPISGLPSDACAVLAYGWDPTSFGHVLEPGGDSIIAIDPNAGQLYVLSIPQSLGSFASMSYLPGYPFY
ncbi:MAG: hypothetical protein ACRETO_11765 [Gammaproteobacteria bacterium]